MRRRISTDALPSLLVQVRVSALPRNARSVALSRATISLRRHGMNQRVNIRDKTVSPNTTSSHVLYAGNSYAVIVAVTNAQPRSKKFSFVRPQDKRGQRV